MEFNCNCQISSLHCEVGVILASLVWLSQYRITRNEEFRLWLRILQVMFISLSIQLSSMEVLVSWTGTRKLSERYGNKVQYTM